MVWYGTQWCWSMEWPLPCDERRPENIKCQVRLFLQQWHTLLFSYGWIPSRECLKHFISLGFWNTSWVERIFQYSYEMCFVIILHSYINFHKFTQMSVNGSFHKDSREKSSIWSSTSILNHLSSIKRKINNQKCLLLWSLHVSSSKSRLFYLFQLSYCCHNNFLTRRLVHANMCLFLIFLGRNLWGFWFILNLLIKDVPYLVLQ